MRNSIHTGFGSCGIPAAPPGRSYKMPAQRLTSFSISHLTIHGAQGCDRAASGQRRDKNSTPPDLRPHRGSRRDGLKAPRGIGGAAGGFPQRVRDANRCPSPPFFLPLLCLCRVQEKSLARGTRSPALSWAFSPVDREPRSTCQSFLNVQLDYQSGVWDLFIDLFISIHLRSRARFGTQSLAPVSFSI